MKTAAEYQDLLRIGIGWTTDEHSDFYFEQAMEYLHHYMPNNKSAVRKISQAKTFWKWWENQWNRRNRLLYVRLRNEYNKITPAQSYDAILYNNTESGRIYVENQYKAAHGRESIKEYPSRVVLELSMAEPIKTVNT